MTEWFWVWCHLNSISTAFQATFSRFSIIALFPYFWVYKVQINVDLLFDHCFIFLRTKTEIYKNEFNLINLDGFEALKRQIPGTWLGIWLNHIEIYVIWNTSHLFSKLHSHISVLWCFCRISVISEFSFLGIGLNTKARKSQKIFIFGSMEFKCMWICFSTTIWTFSALKLKQINKTDKRLTNLEGLVSFEREKYGIWLARWLNYFENDVTGTIFLEITFSYVGILGFLMNFCDFPVFVFEYRAKNENPEITENLYL